MSVFILAIGENRVYSNNDGGRTRVIRAWETLKGIFGLVHAEKLFSECAAVFKKKDFNAWEFLLCYSIIMRLKKAFRQKKDRLARLIRKFKGLTIEKTPDTPDGLIIEGLVVVVKGKRDWRMVKSTLTTLTDKHGAYTKFFLQGCKMAFGAHYLAEDFCELTAADFIAGWDMDMARKSIEKTLKNFYTPGSRAYEDSLKEAMSHYTQTSAGLVWKE